MIKANGKKTPPKTTPTYTHEAIQSREIIRLSGCLGRVSSVHVVIHQVHYIDTCRIRSVVVRNFHLKCGDIISPFCKGPVIPCAADISRIRPISISMDDGLGPACNNYCYCVLCALRTFVTQQGGGRLNLHVTNSLVCQEMRRDSDNGPRKLQRRNTQPREIPVPVPFSSVIHTVALTSFRAREGFEIPISVTGNVTLYNNARFIPVIKDGGPCYSPEYNLYKGIRRPEW